MQLVSFLLVDVAVIQIIIWWLQKLDTDCQ
jgi:hypothetical protein